VDAKRLTESEAASLRLAEQASDRVIKLDYGQIETSVAGSRDGFPGVLSVDGVSAPTVGDKRVFSRVSA